MSRFGFLSLVLIAFCWLSPFSHANQSEPVSAIHVSGAVKSPGEYPYQSGLTALNAIILAGGFEDLAKPSEAKIERTDMTGKALVIAVNIKNILRGTNDDVPLMPGDHLVIPQ